MKDIYSSASKTLIWLGKEDNDMLPVSELLHAIMMPQFNYQQKLTNNLLQNLQQRAKSTMVSRSGTTSFAISFLSLGQEIFSDSGRPGDVDYIGSLINILNKPWFSRAWIVQEAAPSREPNVILGPERFDLRVLHHLMVVATCLEVKATGSRIHSYTSQVLRSRVTHTLRHIQVCREQIEDNIRRRLSFFDILQRLAFSTDASDTRDLVHAGLVFQDPTEGQILPDYSLETSAAYADTSASVTRSARSLSILGLVRGAKYPSVLGN